MGTSLCEPPRSIASELKTHFPILWRHAVLTLFAADEPSCRTEAGTSVNLNRDLQTNTSGVRSEPYVCIFTKVGDRPSPALDGKGPERPATMSAGPATGAW